MIRRTALLLASTLVLATGAVVTAAAQEEGTVIRIERIDVGSHPDVNITVSVPLDVAADGLPEGTFGVLENGDERAVQVSEVATQDLQVLLLIDTTGSMGGEPMAVARAAATDFVQQLPDDVQIAVLDYDVETRVVTPFSTDKQAHVAGIQGLQAAGSTATYDAVGVALDTFPADSEARQVIVLLTDGEDNASTTPLGVTADRLAGTGVTLYAIEFMTAFTDSPAIGQLVAASGGEAKPADDPGSLARVYDEIAAQLSNQYALAYRSEAGGSTEVKVRLDHERASGTATRMVDFPAAGPPPPEAPPPPAPAPEPVIGGVPAVGFLGSTAAMALGLTAVFVALLLILLALLTPRERRASLRMPGTGARERIKGISGMSDWLTGATDRVLQRQGWGSGLNAALERAGINLRPGEFMILVLSIAVAAGAAGFLLSGTLLAVLFGAVTVILARLSLSVLADRRRAKFADQLGDTLQLLAGGLRAGYSIMQAVDSVAREAESPTSDEFRRLIVETRLGRDVRESLQAMAQRLESEDFEWVVEAIEIQREVGGDLAEVLDTVAGTIRERNQIRRQVKALSAEGRLSAVILFVLPFAVGGFVLLTNPGYVDELFVTTPGRIMLAVAAVLMTAGAVWLRKIIRIEF